MYCSLLYVRAVNLAAQIYDVDFCLARTLTAAIFSVVNGSDRGEAYFLIQSLSLTQRFFTVRFVPMDIDLNKSVTYMERDNSNQLYLHAAVTNAHFAVFADTLQCFLYTVRLEQVSPPAPPPRYNLPILQKGLNTDKQSLSSYE